MAGIQACGCFVEVLPGKEALAPSAQHLEHVLKTSLTNAQGRQGVGHPDM